MMSNGSTKKKTKTIIGIDYSLTSPAVCVNGNKFYYLTSKKKWQLKINEDIIISFEEAKKELNLRKKNASTKTNSN